MTSTVTVERRIPTDWATGEMRADVRRGLSMRPRSVPAKWLYDDRGSELFDEITRLAEYYPTEAERTILRERATHIAQITAAHTVIELGAGTSDKTRTLLDAFWAADQLERFVPLDVSEATLVSAANALAERYPGLEVHAVVADFTRHLDHLPSGGPRLVAFLGGTVGNFYAEERRAFLGALADCLEPNDWLLLGIDLIKPIDRILAAYHDDEGVTEAFIANVLTILNRELDADFDVGNFEYTPLWDTREERVDMRLRANRPEHARVGALDLDIDVAAGEELRVEISTKFRPERIQAELADAGFGDIELMTDPRGEFGLLLARRLTGG